ncbi:MAG: chorismate lyase [Halieaceae bacterium]|jgi:chorismate--pyruvate lyase|nr:chorismate lyase [Halieaceae bacterium]
MARPRTAAPSAVFAAAPGARRSDEVHSDARTGEGSGDIGAALLWRSVQASSAAAAAAFHWRPQERVPGPLLAPVRRWLLDDGSLTQHLVNTGRRFSVDRWAQHFAAPTLDERRLLQMGTREHAMVRQVVLCLDEQPVVFARSVFPVSSLRGPLKHLRRLSNQSLGAFLFARPDMRRSPFELALMAGDSSYLPLTLHQRAPAWARRSCFVVDGKPLLVSEVFLSGFRGWPAVMPLHRSRRGQVDVTIGGSAR